MRLICSERWRGTRHVEVVGSTCIDSKRGGESHLGRKVGASASRNPKRLAVRIARQHMKLTTPSQDREFFTARSEFKKNEPSCEWLRAPEKRSNLKGVHDSRRLDSANLLITSAPKALDESNTQTVSEIEMVLPCLVIRTSLSRLGISNLKFKLGLDQLLSLLIELDEETIRFHPLLTLLSYRI